MICDLIFSNALNCEWATPRDFFKLMDEAFGPFDLDACATPENAKAGRYYTQADDGLSRDWHRDGKSVWMNPPYGREIEQWLAKAYAESQKGCKVTCLVNAKTDTRWWHRWARRGEIYLIPGRLKFNDGHNSAPFPSAVIVYHSKPVAQALGLERA
jgi:site-specific DNA-methyltransferase (adenine-specific)